MSKPAQERQRALERWKWVRNHHKLAQYLEERPNLMLMVRHGNVKLNYWPSTQHWQNSSSGMMHEGSPEEFVAFALELLGRKQPTPQLLLTTDDNEVDDLYTTVDSEPDEPPPPPLAPLSDEQAAALKRILTSRGNTILTGAAGAGKSHVVKHLAQQTWVTITGTTGKAALNVGGITVDRLFCFKRDDWSVRDQYKLKQNMQDCAPIIIIDEGSMAGLGMLQLIDRIVKKHNKRVVLVGDWAQASPVKDMWAIHGDFFREAQYIKLTECHRQAAGPYLDALNKLRVGVVDDTVRSVFAACLVNAPPDDEHVIRMYATNSEADGYNDRRLYLVAEQTPIVNLMAELKPAKSSGHKTQEFIEKQLNDCKLAHRNGVRCGARVIMTVNDADEKFVNGDTGTILDIRLADGTSIRKLPYSAFTPPIVESAQIESLTIQLDREKCPLNVGRARLDIRDLANRPDFTLVGFPVRLGWAITVHRSQGTTLDKAFVDMQSVLRFPEEGRHGIAYVALSRTRTIEGLQIANWTDDAVFCSDIVKPYV